MQIPTNRRIPQNRQIRHLVLTANLMATLLEQAGADADNPFSRSVRFALEAWEHALADIRQGQDEYAAHCAAIDAHFGRHVLSADPLTTSPGAQP
jgi:hypothetical protein